MAQASEEVEIIERRRFSGAFLVSEERALLLQLRDASGHIDNPARISTFGGSADLGEDALDCLRRELQEELGTIFSDSEIAHLASTSKIEGGVLTECEFYVVHPVRFEDLRVTEGSPIELSLASALADARLTPTCRRMLDRLAEHDLFRDGRASATGAPHGR